MLRTKNMRFPDGYSNRCKNLGISSTTPDHSSLLLLREKRLTLLERRDEQWNRRRR